MVLGIGAMALVLAFQGLSLGACFLKRRVGTVGRCSYYCKFDLLCAIVISTGDCSRNAEGVRHQKHQVLYARLRVWDLVIALNLRISNELIPVLLCRLLSLLAPAASHMDLNIGAALWLAARAHGTLHLPECQRDSSALRQGQPFCSRARVVLLGHGADEVFAGYGRHRTAARFGARAGLQAELELDMQRLWIRNLGRDDRLIADTSREARHPFLDEDLLAAVAALPLASVADLKQPAGTGDKAVLRGVARSLGLLRAAARGKRAIQFGSRIAKQANVRDFGSNRAANRQKVGAMPLAETSHDTGS